MKIPAENLYYVLCYAWERLDRLVAVPDNVRTSVFDLPQNLLARLLHDSFSQVLRRGLDRSYREWAEDTRRPRGKLDLPSTARRALRARGQVRVRFEELGRDVLHNRIVKTTMLRLAAVEELSTDLKGKLTRLVQRIADVGEVDLREDLFRRVQIHRNNADDGFLLDLCRMIARHVFPDIRAGAVRFRDFTTDEREMGRLFEDFVRGFLRTEHPPARALFRHARTRNVKWSGAGGSGWLRFVTLDLDLILSRLRLGDIVGRLQTYPGFRRRAEGLGQPDRHVTGDPCTAIHQVR